MFLNKMKEQLSPDNKGSPSFPHSSHYPTAVLTMDAGGRVVPKQEGGGVQLNAIGGHLHQPHTSQNITVVPVQSAGIMTAGEKTKHQCPFVWRSSVVVLCVSLPCFCLA